MNTGASVWDRHPELTTQLKELNLTGEHSLRDIATILGHGLTRNAVCGRLHRLKIAVVAKADTQGRVRAKPAPRMKIMAEPEVPEPEAVPVKNGELEYHHCKWPVGDPAQHDFRFCGGVRLQPTPYCRKHLKVAFNRQQQPARIRPW